MCRETPAARLKSNRAALLLRVGKGGAERDAVVSSVMKRVAGLRHISRRPQEVGSALKPRRPPVQCLSWTRGGRSTRGGS
jgi:hypothetical protein